MAHLNDDIESQLKIGTLVNCLTVRNKLNESKYKNEDIKNNEFLQLSLKNSLIKGAKQYFLIDYLNHLQIPLFLGKLFLSSGVNHLTSTGKWAENQIIIKDNTYNNETILPEIVKDLGIKEFGSLFSTSAIKDNQTTGFCYEKYLNLTSRMRKIQNYDWADDCLKKGIDLINSNFYDKAIEYLKDAEKLDPLNKDIYIQKGLAHCGAVTI